MRAHQNLFVCYVVMVMWLLGGCISVESILFQPPEVSYRDDKTVLKLESEPGVKISAMYLHNAKAKYTVLYSHGNANDLGDLMPFFKNYRQSGFSIFAYDYRGYGTSQGKPTESNTYKDVEAAYTYLTERLGRDPNTIIVHGRSLGSGPATHLAANKKVGGLILESGFKSVFSVVSSSEASLAEADLYKNIEKIKAVSCPVLVIHGKLDEVIPFQHGEQMYEAVAGPKQHYWVEQAGHNYLLRVAKKDYWKTLQAFGTLIDKVRSEKNKKEK